MREYEAAVGRAAMADAQAITFKLGGREITAQPPTAGQLALFVRGGRQGALRSIESLIEFLSDLVNDADWRYIENQLRDGLDVAVLSDIANDLVGEWSGRPTSPSSGSAPTPKGTGRRSTAKPRATASTTSRSR